MTTTTTSCRTPRPARPLPATVAAALGVALLGGALLAGGCAGPDPDAAAQSITAEELADLTRELSSDRFQGRGPAGAGEPPTLEYLQAEYRRLGLVPMGDPVSEVAGAPGVGPEAEAAEGGGEPQDGDGEAERSAAGQDGAPRSYLQRVPMVGITADPGTATLSIPPSRGAARRGALRQLEYGADFVAWTTLEEATIDVTAPLVFVGYGIVAPEENWDDYGDRDLSGTILVMLVNDPPLDDPERFGGDAMTYYGRWTYKFEEAARQGAVGALLVHTTDSAGYGWNVVESSWSGEQFHLPHDPGSPEPVALEGWLSYQAASSLFGAAGHDLLDLAQRARSEDFSPVDLGIAATAHLDNSMRRITSYNVLGAVAGSDPEVTDEHVVYTAHWDHFGVGAPVDGDAIYNGAFDNASGTAALLELAEAFAEMEEGPRRSLLFFATTAEEQGLLGTKHYVSDPTVPLDETLAVINIDGLNVWGPTRDVTVIGLGQSSLDDRLATVLREHQGGRTLTPDPEPDKGYYYRSDHFPFAKAGVPALYTDAGTDFVDRPEDYSERVREDYRTNRYHQPSDEFDPEWNFEGAAEDVRALYWVGWGVANDEEWPRWSPDSEFRAARERMLRDAGR